MRYIKLKMTCLTALAAIMLIAGCSAEEESGNGPVVIGGENVTVLMTLNIPGAVSTRGLTPAQEKSVNSIDIMVFDKDLKLTDWQYGQLKSEQGNISFTATLKASKDNDDKFRLMVLANVRNTVFDILGGADFGGHKGKTYDEVRLSLQAATPSYSDIISEGIPMWGELKDMVLLAGTDISYEMDLLRSLSRIDVGTNPAPDFAPTGQITGWKSLDNFSLEKVYVYNESSTCALAADRDNYSFTGKRVSAVSLPSPNTKKSTAQEYSDNVLPGTVTRNDGKGVSVTENIYTGEADVKMGSSGAYADNNHANRAALVVAGYYSPDPLTPNTTELSYYRLDFIAGSGSYALTDILRNNDYQVVIRSVNGPGSRTAAEAFEKFDTDMVAVVNGWSNSGQKGTTVDGDYYLNTDPYDFELDKWGRTDEEIAIETNVSESSGICWNATVEKYDNSDPDPAWLTITSGTESGISGDILKFNVGQAPSSFTTSDSRSARLRISAGTIVHDIIVTQTGRDFEHLLRLSHSELVFAGRQWDEVLGQWADPDPQTITVNWNPRKWPYYLSLTDYTGSGVDMAAAIPDDNNTPALTISPTAIAVDNKYLKDNPFFERSSRLAFTSMNTDGTKSITKRILIRQIYYSLVVSETKDYYYLGNTYTLNIKSNSPWTATFGGDDSIFASCSSTSGNGNTSSGENLTFTISNSAEPNDRATVTFSSPDNLFPPQTFNIIVQDELPNCYVITPGHSQVIPVRKAYRVWELDHDLYNDGSELPDGDYGAKLLWQDTDLITYLSFNGTGRNGRIIIRTNPNKDGNAVVAFTIDDKVYWSWHLWITAYDPESSTNQGTANGYIFMNRNLGAFSTSGYRSFGLYYQGGRKDPFPPTASESTSTRKPVYDINDTELPYYQPGGIMTVSAPPYDGLREAIREPMHFLYGAYGNTHWHGLLYDATRTDLWENGTYKSDYDPCPGGWTVATEASLSGMFSLSQGISAGYGGFSWSGMWFPAQWHLTYGNGLVSGMSISEFSLWYVRTGKRAPLRFANSTSERGSNGRQCNGAPLRCIKR